MLTRRKFLRSFALAGGGLWLPRGRAQQFGGFGIPFLSGGSAGAGGLLSGLVSYWNMDQASNTTRTDSVGTQNLADHNSNTAATPGVISNGLTITSSDTANGLLASDTPYRAGPGVSFSLAGWANSFSASNFKPMFSKWGVATEYRVYRNGIGFGTDPIDWEVTELTSLTARSVTLFTAINTPNTGWYHVAVGYDTALQQIWCQVNAGTRSSSACADVSQSTNPLIFGNYNNGGVPGSTPPASVSLDEWGFWSRSLTTAEVTTLYNGGAGKTYPF